MGLTESSQLVDSLTRRLGQSGTVAVAESCTGGLLGAAITEQAGVSSWFRGGVIAYHNQVKMELLGVAAELLERHGAVSKECAEAMSLGVRQAVDAEFGLAVTGIAGPGGGSAEKPVGLVFISCSTEGRQATERCVFTGNRAAIRRATVVRALRLLDNFLS